MAGKDIIVATNGLHIDAGVHGGLATIKQHLSPGAMGQFDNPPRICNRAENIRHVCQRDHPRFRPDRRFKLRHVERAIFIQANPSEHRALTLAQEMPGHDIGMMLHQRQHDFVAGGYLAGKSAGDEIDRFRRALGEDDLLDRARIQKAAHILARVFEGLRGLICQRVQAAMNIRIGGAHLPGHCLDYRFGLLRAGGIVEIDKRFPVHLARKDRELVANGGGVEI